MSEEKTAEVSEQLEQHLAAWDATGLGDGELSARLGDHEPADAWSAGEDRLTDFDFSAPDERDRRIAELEAEAAQRADDDAEALDRVELERSVRKIIKAGAGASRETIEAALIGKFVQDPDFRSAYERRGEDSLPWQFELEQFGAEFPRAGGDRGLRAAVLASRDVTFSADAGDYGDFSKMSTAEFSTAKARVFEDVRAGRLGAARGRGGCFSTSSR